MFWSDAQPAVHRATTHHRHLGLGCLQQLAGLGRIDPDEDSALTARRDGHVAADQEGQSSEHPLLGQSRLGAQQLAQALSQLLVVCHDKS
jgi:hypothetical protein